MTCSTCRRLAHVDFASRRTECSGCNRRPFACICLPAVPEWVRRAQEHRLVTKDFSGSAA